MILYPSSLTYPISMQTVSEKIFAAEGRALGACFAGPEGAKANYPQIPTGPPPSAFPPLILWLVVAASARFGHDIEFLSML